MKTRFPGSEAGATTFGDIDGAHRAFNKFVKLNCWHTNEAESAAMWDLYSQQEVAVESTVGRLKASFSEATEDVYVGRVCYLDYERDRIYADEGPVNALRPFLCKRSSFQHEQELRALVPEVPTAKDGKYISVDLLALIRQVHLGPRSPVWLADLSRSLLKRYGLNGVEVVRSPLYDAPP